MQREYQVKVEYDNDARVWIATSDDIIGLVLEDESPEYLMKRVTEAAPELIRLNNLFACKAINFSMTRNEQRDVASCGHAPMLRQRKVNRCAETQRCALQAR